MPFLVGGVICSPHLKEIRKKEWWMSQRKESYSKRGWRLHIHTWRSNSEGTITGAQIIITGIIIASCLEFSPALTSKQKRVEDFNERSKITKKNWRELSKFKCKICRSISHWVIRKVIQQILNDREDKSSFEGEYVSQGSCKI